MFRAIDHPDDRTMLALAAVTYRGFAARSEPAIARSVAPWLRRLDAEGLGRWKLVWGPAAFRADGSIVDDAMVFVAQREDLPTDERPHYAVAIRGTNPASAFDWVFGDLFVQLQVPWTSDRPEAGKLSASTALGLAIVQRLAAEDPTAAAPALAANGGIGTIGLQQLVRAVSGLPTPGRPFPPGPWIGSGRMSWLMGVARPAGRDLLTTALARLRDGGDGAARSLRGAAGRLVFDQLRESVASAPDAGETLLGFLERAVPTKARISVTGHSKGGALAIATALWLDEAWASKHGGEVECFSLAGPTPGDARFKAYYDGRLGKRTRRVVNRRDIVPHAWTPADLRSLHEPYPMLAPAVMALARSVEPHDYRHCGATMVAFDPGHGGCPDGLQEIVHQHLDAYLAAAGFDTEVWNARSIFLGD